jgi:hypothetical protein
MLSLSGDLVGTYAISGRVVKACVRVLGEWHPETIAAMRNRVPILERLQKRDELKALRQTLSEVRSPAAK